ncbi:hypothetical protein GCM10023085_45280 [Actinomadura viridis]|uniref:Signal transduction histidine kinase n=1 Tax=Actinomadura viridis TaxID=58110 RepID=A0A931DNI6_9ACTN|nr:hypothetical protein [Actinomadura viridis]MBG6089888.1 signal transduction histidine kinase [Actinomadura viridis]
MADDPTPGELQRNISDLRHDLRDRHAALSQRLDALAREMVGLPLYQAHVETARREHDELAKDITDVVARLDADQRQRSADRRMILLALFTSVLAPLTLLILQLYLRGKGTAP